MSNRKNKKQNNMKFEELRIRKVNVKDIPFFRYHSDWFTNNAFVVDLKSTHLEVIEEDTAKTITKKIPVSTLPDNNVPMEGLEVVGEPLEVSMMSNMSVNEKNSFTAPSKNFHSGIADESADIDVNYMPVNVALYFVSAFSDSDQIQNAFLQSMEFGSTLPKNFSLCYFCNADDSSSRTIALLTQCVEGVKYSGVLRHHATFDDGVHSFINFMLLSLSSSCRLKNTKCHSVYNSLCNSQMVTVLSKWPKFKLKDKFIVFDDEECEEAEEDANCNEFIPGAFCVESQWTENLTKHFATMDPQLEDNFPVRYFSKPNGLYDAVLTVKPGWLDSRVKGYERTIHVRFLRHMCDCLQKTEINWPSKKEHPQLLQEFRNYVGSVIKAEPKKDSYDFVEGLWDYLICCRSFASLRAIFKETYDLFSRGLLTSKFVHVDNSSTIALILKTMDPVRAGLPRLDSWTCIQMLIEVGVDRLRRDIRNELINKKRFPPSSFSEALKIDPRLSVDERVRCILIMHLVLQSVNLINEHVTVQPAEMLKIFTSLIYQFSNNANERPLDESYSFKTKVCNVECFVLETFLKNFWRHGCVPITV